MEIFEIRPLSRKPLCVRHCAGNVTGLRGALRETISRLMNKILAQVRLTWNLSSLWTPARGPWTPRPSPPQSGPSLARRTSPVEPAHAHCACGLTPPLYYNLAEGIAANRRINDALLRASAAPRCFAFYTVEPKFGDRAIAEIGRIARLDKEQEHAILSGNAKRLLGFQSARVLEPRP